MKPTRRILILLLIGLSGAVLNSLFPEAGGQPAQHPETTGPGQRSGQATQTREPPLEGPGEVLQRAIIELERLRSLSARTRQQVELFGTPLVGTGRYFEQRTPQGLDLRLELSLQGEQVSSLVQVCRGPYLWIYRDKEPPVRIDVNRVNRALEEDGEVFEPGRIGAWPGLGGLPKLLRGLRASFDFTGIESTWLGEQLPVYRLRGEWKQEKLSKIIDQPQRTPRQPRPGDWDKIPPHLPHYVLLYLERDKLFPRRIEYRRYAPQALQDQPVKKDPTIVSIDVFDVVLNPPISPTWFSFDPGDREFTDQTNRFLGTLGLKKK
jgi:hypothetical protein